MVFLSLTAFKLLSGHIFYATGHCDLDLRAQNQWGLYMDYGHSWLQVYLVGKISLKFMIGEYCSSTGQTDRTTDRRTTCTIT